MKLRSIIVLAFWAFFFPYIVQAQSLLNVDFEENGISPVEIQVESENEAITYSIVDNMSDKRLNTSSKVLKIDVADNYTDTDRIKIILNTERTTSKIYYLHMMMYTPFTQQLFEVNNKVFGEPMNVVYQNEWVDVVYTLPMYYNIADINIIPPAAGTFYIDNIYISDEFYPATVTVGDKDVPKAEEKHGWSINDETVNRPAAMDVEFTLDGQTELHLYNDKSPLVNSIVNIISEDARLYFDRIRPSEMYVQGLMSKIKINGVTAATSFNVRLEIYGEGCVLIPYGPSYTALTVYTKSNLQGESKQYASETYHNALGEFDNKVASFVLKHGYMVTFAENPDGGGFSRVYIADEEDLVINNMPIELDGTISFIRVFPWRYATKKGYCNGSADNHSKLGATWFYSWGPTSSLRSNSRDFAAMVTGRHDWFPFDDVKNATGLNHVLGFNEPDQDDQANMDIQEMLDKWPEMLKSGLRLGSPAYASIGNGLYNFIKECEHRNYRIDFVALHAYFGGWEKSNWLNYFSDTYKNVHRPLWITEWNNGANWTTEGGPKDEAEQKKDITYIQAAMEETKYLERYSVYNWVEDWRRVIRDNDGSLTPAGVVYRDKKSGMAFNKTYEYIKNPAIEKGQRFLILNKRDGYLYQSGNRVKTSGSTSTSGLDENYYWTVEYKSATKATGHYLIRNLGTGDYLVYNGKNMNQGYLMQSDNSGNTSFALSCRTSSTVSGAPYYYYTVSYYNTTRNGNSYSYDYQALDSWGAEAGYMVGSYSDYRSDNQLWAFVPQEKPQVEEGIIYRFANKANKRWMTSKAGGIITNVFDTQYMGQYWKVQQQQDGRFTFTCMHTGLNLAIVDDLVTLATSDSDDESQQLVLTYAYRKDGTSYFKIGTSEKALCSDGFTEVITGGTTTRDVALWSMIPYNQEEVQTGETLQQISGDRLINYPNPVTESTTFAFYLPEEGDKAILNVYDNSGKLVATQLTSAQAGDNRLFWLKGNLSGGIYLYEIIAEKSGGVYYRANGKMIIK